MEMKEQIMDKENINRDVCVEFTSDDKKSCSPEDEPLMLIWRHLEAKNPADWGELWISVPSSQILEGFNQLSLKGIKTEGAEGQIISGVENERATLSVRSTNSAVVPLRSHLNPQIAPVKLLSGRRHQTLAAPRKCLHEFEAQG
ncbi:hypothetical protein NQZ68_026862 [Dissostichus eleginoides]|nr:hypothetical protein NQZ68_026862 [Dissostichus eleginoides]